MLDHITTHVDFYVKNRLGSLCRFETLNHVESLDESLCHRYNLEEYVERVHRTTIIAYDNQCFAFLGKDSAEKKKSQVKANTNI